MFQFQKQTNTSCWLSEAILRRATNGTHRNCLHSGNELSEDNPVGAVAVNIVAKWIRVPTINGVVSKKVKRDLLSHELRVHHDGDFFEEANKLAFLNKGYGGHCWIVKLKHTKYLKEVLIIDESLFESKEVLRTFICEMA